MSSDLIVRSKMGEIWIRSGKVSEAQLAAALVEQQRSPRRLGKILTEWGLLTEKDVTEARAVQMGVAFCDVTEVGSDPDALGLITLHVARAYRVLPLSVDEDSFTVAMANPVDIDTLDMLQRLTRLRPDPRLAEDKALRGAINQRYAAFLSTGATGEMPILPPSSVAAEPESILREAPPVLVEPPRTPIERPSSPPPTPITVSAPILEQLQPLEPDDSPIARGDGPRPRTDPTPLPPDRFGDPSASATGGDTTPVVAIVNKLIIDAVRLGASDIHIEPRRENVEVRNRIDGVLRRVNEIPKNLQLEATSRLKIMAEMDIAERRLPQDGRIPVVVDGKEVDLRVSTLPTHYGERIVMRLLDKTANIRGIGELNMLPGNQERFQRLIRNPHGLILVTGPTGSGKTTTLYSALGSLMDEATNIITCEDPIEYEVHGINQSAVHEKAGLTFARQLRAILRQDPDVVLVGEIRDPETAEIAFRAAMTGHLVLSTLHANDGPTTVTRLIDMGVPPFLIASALAGVVAQRLTRRLCPECRVEGNPSATEAQVLGIPVTDTIFHAGPGCDACGGKGYKGRVAIHEVLSVTEDFTRLIIAQAPGAKLRAAAVAGGMVTLRDDAVAKAKMGQTSPAEVVKKICAEADEA